MSKLATGQQKACCKGQYPVHNHAHGNLLQAWIWLHAQTILSCSMSCGKLPQNT